MIATIPRMYLMIDFFMTWCVLLCLNNSACLGYFLAPEGFDVGNLINYLTIRLIAPSKATNQALLLYINKPLTVYTHSLAV